MGDKSDLSDRQRKVLAMIQDFVLEYGYPPTIRQIGQAASISSTSVVTYNLNVLQRKGYLTRDPDVSRGLRLVAGESVETVPFLGVIAAGQPIPIPDNDFVDADSEYIAVTSDIVKDTDNVYALRVSGTSMIDALIDDGDIVIVRHQNVAENGDTVVAWLPRDKETTLKSFYFEEKRRRVRLQPRNPLLEPIYRDPDEVEIQGKVIGVIRRFD